jgi:3',5'-cyclic AMP phosphodiesterase CpdA
LLLDSNEVLATFSNGLNLRNVLGRGRVGSDQIGQVITEYQEFLRNPALHPAGFDSTTAIRLAVMHHHPAIPVQQPQDFEQELLRLQDAEEVTQLFRYELQTHLVLCGHQHFPYLYPDPNDGRPWLTCAGTATQSESEINSFKLYWVYQTSPPARLEVEEYRRERSSPTGKFQPQPRISVPLGQ